MDFKLRQHCQKRKAAFLAERKPFESDWKQVADYVDPFAGRFLMQGTTTNTQKLPSRSKIINSAATKALRTMDSGFMGGHTSKSRAWFRLSVSDTKMMDQQGVREWLDQETQAIRDMLARSNFYTALPELYRQRHLFGIASMLVDEDEEDVVRFYPRSIGTYALGYDNRGRNDAIWYSFRWTANQIKAKWGDENLPQKVRTALAGTGNAGDTKFTIETLIEKNPDAGEGASLRADKRPYRQVYWIDGNDNEKHGCLDIGGYYQYPALAVRWVASGTEIYGPSPSLDALGDIKQLQYLEGEKLRMIDLTSRPPMALPESLRHKGASLNPGSKVYVLPDQLQAKAEAIYTPDPRGLLQVQAEIDKVKERIEQAYFADLFRMLDYLDDRERTAYEISERKEEKVAMLGPALESLTDDLLDPCIELLFDIRTRRGLVADPPPALQGIPVKIEYTSVLAQAQKAHETGTVERVLGIVGQLAEAKQDPSVWDKIDIDTTIEIVHDAQGAPARMLVSDEDVAGIREGRAQAQKQAQAAAMAPAMKQGAEAAKVMGETVPQKGSMLEAMQQSQAAPA